MKSALLLAAGLVLSSTTFAGTLAYTANLSGLSEVPPNASPATGSAEVVVDTVAQTMFVDVSFSGLLGTTTASHIHCCTASPGAGNAGVATAVPTFTGFPLGVTSGTYTHTFDLTLSSSYNPSFVTANGGVAGAEAALLAGLAADKTYLNVHSSVFPGGEIRGYLTLAAPEPGTFLLAGAAVLGLLLKRKI